MPTHPSQSESPMPGSQTTSADAPARRNHKPGGRRLLTRSPLVPCALSVALATGLTIGNPAPTYAAQAPVTVSLLTTTSGDGIINLSTNQFTRFAERAFNINFQWTNVPGSDLATKQSLLIASGNYPDAFWASALTPAELEQDANEGIVVPLNNLIKTYAPNVWHAINTNAAVRLAAEDPSGRILDIPSYNYCFHCYYSAKLWVNVDLLRKYSLPMPLTTTQLEQDLKVLVAHGYLPLEGDTNGWHGNVITQIMNAFIYDPGKSNSSGYFDVGNNNSLVFAPAQPGWRRGLTFMHQLYTEHLLDPSSFTQPDSVLQQEWSRGKLALFADGAMNDIISNYGAPGTDYQAWLPIPPLAGPSGVRRAAFFGNGSQASIAFSLTNKASKAQAIALMKLINYIWTPSGTETFDFGPEGQYWKPAAPGEHGLVQGKALFDTNWNHFYSGSGLQNSGWNEMGTMDQDATWRNYNATPPAFTPNGSQAVLQLVTQAFYAGFAPTDVVPGYVWVAPSEAQQYSQLATNINDYVNEWSAQLVTGAKPLSDWAQYVRGLNSLGLSKYTALTAKYAGKRFVTTQYGWSKADVDFLLGEVNAKLYAPEVQTVRSVCAAIHHTTC
jgi:putative aldouronate transport system substrate-binding protein